MQKQKAILKIKSFSHKDGELLLYTDDYSVRAMLKGITDLCSDKYGGFIRLEMSAPYKARSTGLGSQNSKFWALAQEIAREIGEDVKEVEKDLKLKALSRGYPYHYSKITGQPIPESMTKVDTVQMSALIESAMEVCAFLGINPDVN